MFQNLSRCTSIPLKIHQNLKKKLNYFYHTFFGFAKYLDCSILNRCHQNLVYVIKKSLESFFKYVESFENR